VRVELDLGDADAVGLEPERLRTAVHNALDRWHGGSWNTTVGLRFGIPPLHELDAAHASVLSADPDAKRDAAVPSKWVIVRLQGHGAGWHVEGREFDETLHDLGPVREVMVWGAETLPAAAARLAASLVRPLGSIESIDGNDVAARVVGSAFTPDDPALSPRATRYWVPVYRYLNSEGNVERLQPVPWTYLETVPVASGGDSAKEEDDALNWGKLPLRLVTGVRSPLTMRRRSSVQLWALGVQPDAVPTRMTLRVRKQPGVTLAGLDMETRPERDPGPESPPPLLRLQSDLRGEAAIPPHPETPLVWLTVRNGQHRLARVPLIPGLEPHLDLELPDDTIRLTAEAQLTVVQSDLMDAVGRRAVLMARIKRLAKEDDWTGVAKVRAELALVPKASDLTARIDSIRIAGLQAAKTRGDSGTAAQVRQACEEAVEITKKFLSDDKLKTLDEELEMIKADKKTEKSLLKSK